MGVPTLGICYGMQLMAQELGGSVERTGVSEFGKTDVRAERRARSSRAAGRADRLDEPPRLGHRAARGRSVTASSPPRRSRRSRTRARRSTASSSTRRSCTRRTGQDLLKNFLYDVADAPPTWTAAAVIEEQVERIRAQVGSERVLCALSGGVDSAVAALLVHKAVGDQLVCVFVDHGLLRKDEAEQVVETFERPLPRAARARRGRRSGPHAARRRRRPGEKRKAVGEEFIRVFEDESQRLGKIRFLVQGTLYSDVIESGGDAAVAAKIKSHHNVGGLPRRWRWSSSSLCGSCSRTRCGGSARSSGSRRRMVWRQPFPGPGLAIRIIGEVTQRAARDPA
jgi:GMP synthase (glutamine-hydrolysing)